MNRYSLYRQFPSRRPTRLVPICATPRPEGPTDVSENSDDRSQQAFDSTAGSPRAHYQTRALGRGRADVHHAATLHPVPLRQSKPLGRCDVQAAHACARRPSATAVCSAPVAAAAMVAPSVPRPPEESAAALTSSFHHFCSHDEEAYAAAHGLPHLFTRLVHDLSVAEASDRVDSDQSRLREWFTRELAASPASATDTHLVHAANKRSAAKRGGPRDTHEARATLPPLLPPLPRVPVSSTVPMPRAPTVMKVTPCDDSRPVGSRPRGSLCSTGYCEQDSSTSLTPIASSKQGKAPVSTHAEALSLSGGAVHGHQRGSLDPLPADQTSIPVMLLAPHAN